MKKAKVADALRSTLGDYITDGYVEPKVTVEIREMDDLTTEGEVTTELYINARDVEALLSKHSLKIG